MSADFLATAFGLYTALLSVLVGALLRRYLPMRAWVMGVVALAAWLAYVGVLAGLGVLRDASLRPPGIAFLALPALAGVVLVSVAGPTSRLILDAVPVWLLIGLQTYRIGVELALHRLHELGLMSHVMTLAGGNFEIVVALAAPLAAWLSTRDGLRRRIAAAWNVIGLVSLLNVAVRGVLAAPGSLHLASLEPSNVAIGHLPYSYIPGLMVPLALILHVLAWRSLRTAVSPGAVRREMPRLEH